MQQIIIQGYTLEQLAEALKPLLNAQAVASPQAVEETDGFIKPDEVCKLLKFNKTSLWKHTKSGRLKNYGIGGTVLYKRSEVLEAVKPINH